MGSLRFAVMCFCISQSRIRKSGFDFRGSIETCFSVVISHVVSLVKDRSAGQIIKSVSADFVTYLPKTPDFVSLV